MKLVRSAQFSQGQELAAVVGGDHGIFADGLKAADKAIAQHVAVGGAGDPAERIPWP